MVSKKINTNEDRIKPCNFGDKIGCKCGILDKTICTEFQKSKCTFYITREDYINNQLKSRELLKRRKLSTITVDKTVKVIPAEGA